MRSPVAVAVAAAIVAPATLAADVDRSAFRYERVLRVEAAQEPVAFEPDGLLFAHAKPGFADLRVVDANGEQVPWRRLPERRTEPFAVGVLNSGRRGNAAVALLDVGPARRIYDRVDLDVPDSSFVGRVTVLGADGRSGPFTRLSTTGIYDLAGARHARSTTAVFPPTDFRFLRLRATGVSRIRGATLSGTADRPRLVQRRARLTVEAAAGGRTVLVLDFGVRGTPVSEIVITASERLYDRRIVVEGSNDRRVFAVLATGRIFRFPGSGSAPVSLASRSRFLRITIVNGEDEPLSGIDAEARGRSHALLLEPGHPPPFRLLYGGPTVEAPEYEFARLPAPEARTMLSPGQLMGREQLNVAFDPPPDTRSFAERHGWAVEATLAAAALVVALAGLLALRRRA